MINCSEGFHYFICICLSMLLFATPINNREVKHNRDNLAYVSINRAVGEYLFIIPSRQTGGRNRRPRAIETLAHSVLLWDHYVAGERKGARRDACTRAASNGRWCRGPAHDAAAYVKGNGTGGRGEGRRGIARTPLPPVNRPVGAPLPSFCFSEPTGTLTCWCGWAHANSAITTPDEEKGRLSKNRNELLIPRRIRENAYLVTRDVVLLVHHIYACCERR